MNPTENRQLYTPAMLAELLGVSVRTVRRWQRAGFLQPVSEVMRLPYFDYTGLATARQLATWLRQGASVQSIQTQLDALRQRAGESVSLQQLPITAEGKRLVLRQGEQYVEATGQLRFGFDPDQDEDSNERPATLQFETALAERQRTPVASGAGLSLDAMVNAAIDAEDEGDLDTAIDWYRAALAAHGPNADISFQLAELLYREGDIHAARERYFMSLELNPDLVEARANLGCVLAECGQIDLAIAAFEGALEQFAEYADVHFHLARALDEYGDHDKAVTHWQRFVELAPASPWAEEAAERLRHGTPFFDF